MPLSELVIGSFDDDAPMVDATRADRLARVAVAAQTRVRVVLGRGSRADVELNVDACLEDRVEVVRRRGGGCAVVLDPGNLTVAIALPVSGIGQNRQWFDKISRWMIDALDDAGVPEVATDGISDLVLNNRKVGGSCIHRTHDVLYYSATVLLNPDVDLMERYLRHPPKEPAYRQGRGHSEFVGSIGERSIPPFARRLETALRAHIAESFPVA